MKAVAYSIKRCEKEPLTIANGKKHDITLISNRLTLDTVSYAKGKEAVLVFSSDDVSAPVLRKLKELGVNYVCTRSTGTDHIDTDEAALLDIKIANIPAYSPESIAEHALMLMLALVRNVIPAHAQTMQNDFRLDDLVGTTIHGKTVGIVGFGQTGQAMARMLSGFGVNLLISDVSDIKMQAAAVNGRQVDYEELIKSSDIISFHVPLTNATRHMVNANTIAKMKKGVILINVSRGAVFNSKDVYDALQNEHIAKIGMDVYEFEHNVFFFDHSRNQISDKLLRSFIQHSRVILTPHQAFLTEEALRAVSSKTIENLDRWARMKDLEPAVCAISV